VCCCTIRGYSDVDDRTASLFSSYQSSYCNELEISPISMTTSRLCKKVLPYAYKRYIRWISKCPQLHPYCSWGIALWGDVVLPKIRYRSGLISWGLWWHLPFKWGKIDFILSECLLQNYWLIKRRINILRIYSHSSIIAYSLI